jgi:hypothetical protein
MISEIIQLTLLTISPAQQFPAFDRSFRLRLATDIFFADLVTALNPVLLNKTFGDDKKLP